MNAHQHSTPGIASAQNSRPRAIVAGKLFGDHGPDCYILADGRRLIAQSDVLRTLRGVQRSGGDEDGNLKRYLARLPSKFAWLASEAGIEFVLPGGGTAIGRPASFYVSVLKAYAEGHTEGELHASQEPMAKRAIQLLSAFAEKGIEAMIDEACGRRGVPDDARLDRAEAEIALLRAHLEQLDPLGSGVIGKARAHHRLMMPLREAARLRCIAREDHSEVSFRREFKDLENALRLHVAFPASLAQRWENLPISKLGDAQGKVAELLERERRNAKRAIASLASRAEQLRLSLS